MRVTSPKTAHHEDKGERIIPLFPELRAELADGLELAELGTEFVVTRYRSPDQNLRTTFTKIVKRAGLTPWPKLLHNLRASRQTELAAEFPAHVVCEWIGNSQAVAKEHYLRVQESDFVQALQNALQTTPDMQRNTQRRSVQAKPEIPEKQRFSLVSRCTKMPPQGLEP